MAWCRWPTSGRYREENFGDWGVADDGLIWTDLLTDHDGPYNEIQAGRFETQLNYEFMPPRRSGVLHRVLVSPCKAWGVDL